MEIKQESLFFTEIENPYKKSPIYHYAIFIESVNVSKEKVVEGSNNNSWIRFSISNALSLQNNYSL
jgi:hypothetical protein